MMCIAGRSQPVHNRSTAECKEGTGMVRGTAAYFGEMRLQPSSTLGNPPSPVRHVAHAAAAACTRLRCAACRNSEPKQQPSG